MTTTVQAPFAELRTAESCEWYVVHTRSRHEKVVYQAMTRTGMESFLPLREVLSQWKDRRKLVQKPLFPGYLFVRTRRLDLWQVSMSRGVARVLGSGDQPIPVPDQQVQDIRRMVEGPYPAVPWPCLQEGSRVRVTSGPLVGLEAYVLRKKRDGKCHLIVTVDLLGRSVAVEIDPRSVEAIC